MKRLLLLACIAVMVRSASYAQIPYPAKIVFQSTNPGTVNFGNATANNKLIIDLFNQMVAGDATGAFGLVLQAQQATLTPTSIRFDNVPNAGSVTLDCTVPDNGKPLCNVLWGAVQLHIAAMDTLMRNAHMIAYDAAGVILFQ